MKLKIKICINVLLISSSFIFFATSNIVAQTSEIEQTRSLTSQAQNLVNQKSWEEAIQLLQEGLQNCDNQKKAIECRVILNFNLGYLYQIKDIGDVKTNHTVAAEYYNKALSDQPHNVQIISNLALVLQHLGKWEEAVNMFNRAAEIDTEKRESYLIAIGDLYLENNHLSQALESYRKAVGLNPTNETAHRKILTLYKRLPVEQIDELFEYSVYLEEINHPELAKDGFDQVINRSFISNSSLAEEALIYWAELSALQGWIDEESLQALPVQEWSSSAINELIGLVGNPEINANNLNWWGENLLRSHVAASILKAVGTHMYVNGEIIRTANVYELALWIAPGFYSYDHELANKPIIRMNIVLELASLYTKHPQLDPNGDKFQDLEDLLFREKGTSYEMGALEAIQRSHTVLGLIYAEREKWSRWGADNGIFQLEHALSTAKQLAEIDPKNFQPLPHLQSLLIKGYSEIGREDKIFTLSLNSAMGYLDLDDISKAEQMLESASTFFATGTVTEKRKHNELKIILTTRQQIEELTQDNFEPD